MTRLYVTQPYVQTTIPQTYKIANFNFYQQTTPQNDNEIYSIAATVVPQNNNQVILTWDHNKSDPNSQLYDVRYSWSDIDTIGWNAATPARAGPACHCWQRL